MNPNFFAVCAPISLSAVLYMYSSTIVPEKKRRDVEILGWWVEPRLLRILGAGQREGGGGVGLLLLRYSITGSGLQSDVVYPG
jgi:hypothetical protein